MTTPGQGRDMGGFLLGGGACLPKVKYLLLMANI
jgi:hypothetical protein